MTQDNTNYGRDQNIINQPGTVIIRGQEKPSRPRNEQLLLKQVKEEVNSRLTQSLHNAVLINLGKQVQPDRVKRPWDAEVKIGSKPAAPLPPETPILEVFERPDITRKLLILGEPGAGKTTTTLDLAQALIQKAETETTEPIPVLLNLSSWKDPNVKMQDWLIEELKSKYGVRKDIGKQWLEEKQLLPLLDGLDEVKPEHQESCVQAINQWLEDENRPMNLLVCSRREEYASYATNLQLNGAILLQALTPAQLEHYLAEINQPKLWQTLNQDAALLELVKTPLLLSITILSYEELSLTQWHQVTSTEKRLELLLDAYVQKMLHREIKSRFYGKQKPPTGKQTRQWLIFLAQQLQAELQTEFLIEKMQPTWLRINSQQWAYRLTVGLIVGLIQGLLINFSSKPSVGIFFGLVAVLLITLTIGLLDLIDELIGSRIVILNIGLRKIVPIETFQILVTSPEARQEGFRRLHQYLVFGSVGGPILSILIFGFIIKPFNPIICLLIGPVIGLIGGLGGSLLGWLGKEEIVFKFKVDIETRVKPNQGIWNSFRNAVIIALFTLIASNFFWFFLKSFFNFGLDQRGITTITVILNTSLIFFVFGVSGGMACIQHFALRGGLYRSGYIPWNYARFLDYCTDRLLLQRIGGRYRFIHKLLQDHFAAMPLERE